MQNWASEHSILYRYHQLQKAPGGWPTGHTARTRSLSC